MLLTIVTALLFSIVLTGYINFTENPFDFSIGQLFLILFIPSFIGLKVLDHSWCIHSTNSGFYSIQRKRKKLNVSYTKPMF
jgi:hypothetical protein